MNEFVTCELYKSSTRFNHIQNFLVETSFRPGVSSD